MREIKGFSGEYRYLSNFYPCKIEYEGLVYSSVEAAFQAAKCSVPAERAAFAFYTAPQAKKAGRQVKLREDWESVKTDILCSLLFIKFRDNPGLLTLLLQTGNAVLIEENRWHDNYYGDCICDRCKNTLGQNLLGVKLMELRNAHVYPPDKAKQLALYMSITLDFEKLLPKAELLAYLKEYGPTDRTLADIREKYEAVLGIDPIWRFPLSDGLHMGTVIIPVREGFLSLPYNDVDSEEYEIFLPDETCLMNETALDTFCDELWSYTEGFCKAMQEAKSLI